MPYCVRPQVGVYAFWKIVLRVQQLCAGELGQFAHAVFGDPVLVVGVAATETESLATCKARLFKIVIGKNAVITMVMLDPYIV